MSNYYIVPVGSLSGLPGESIIDELVGQHRLFGLTKGSGHRADIQEGDGLCFYLARRGVVAHGIATSRAELCEVPEMKGYANYPYIVRLQDVALYLQAPVVITRALREKLEAFQTRNIDHWNWFVLTTFKISEHDFRLLTRQMR